MENWEKSFVKNHLETLSSLPVVYPDNYEQPPHNWIGKLNHFPGDLPPPPKRVVKPDLSNSVEMKVNLKSSKPSLTFPLKVLSTDTVASLKQSLASQPGGPPVDVQRLLLKGKVLADSKLIKEYAVAEGDTIIIMTKPGYVWDTAAAAGGSNSSNKDGGFKTPPLPSSSLNIPTPMEGIIPTSPQGASRSRSQSRSHSRVGSAANIPDLTLSPTPGTGGTTTPGSSSKNPPTTPIAIPLTLDTTVGGSSNSAPSAINAYHTTISKPDFWARLYEFLKLQFDAREDAALAFEEFLVASKSHLTAHEIAKIRDSVGVFGMSGT